MVCDERNLVYNVDGVRLDSPKRFGRTVCDISFLSQLVPQHDRDHPGVLDFEHLRNEW